MQDRYTVNTTECSDNFWYFLLFTITIQVTHIPLGQLGEPELSVKLSQFNIQVLAYQLSSWFLTTLVHF